MKLPKNAKNLTSKTFGKLIVIEPTKKPKKSKSNQRSIWWRCKCECGKIAIVRSAELILGHTKSCGCLKKCPYWESKKYRGCGKLAQSHFSHIKYSATVSRDFEFNVDIKYCWKLFEKQNGKCFYTGLPIELGARNTKGGITASLDRLDSTKGYIKGNLVWCRKDINIMKMDKSHKDFIELCKIIAKNYE